MANDIFWTKVQLPVTTTLAELNVFLAWARAERSIFDVRVNFIEVSVFIVVANRYHMIRYSDCPLPGTHDFAAGWLACETMLIVSKKLGRPVEWTEAEWDEDDLLREIPSQTRVRNRLKPKVTVDWATFGEEKLDG